MSRSSARVSRASRIGRPRRTPDQSAEVRARVIEVARRLFAEEGFEAVSMRRIAASAGCAPMTLYGYFHSKNEILRYIWAVFFDELFARIASVGTEGPAHLRLRRVCTIYLDYWIAHPDRYRMVFLNEDRVGPGERYYVESSAIVERYGCFSDLVAAAQAEGMAWPGDPRRLAETLVCGLQGIAHCLITVPEYPWSASAEQLLERMLAVVLRLAA